jgi:hypothetical protein
MIVRYTIATASAAGYSIRHARALAIARGEWVRYLKKSVYCSLCYVGLGARGTAREAWQAGQAAFLTTAFDVLTDWRGFSPAGAVVFDALLANIVADRDTRRMAQELYERKRSGGFTGDGLERGAIALRLVLRTMDSELQRASAWGDLDDVGRTLQFVDDLLDFDQDVARHDLNCLTSLQGADHLDAFLARYTAGDIHRIFGTQRTVLVRAIERAARRAASMHPVRRLSTDSVPRLTFGL